LAPSRAPVFDAQTEWRRRLEAEPIEMIGPERRGMSFIAEQGANREIAGDEVRGLAW